MIHKKPVAYQIIDDRHVPVDSRFKKIRKNTYGLEVGKYDKRGRLIIDPVIMEYSTYLGGNKNDESFAVAVDSEGCAYVAGSTGSSDFPASPSFPDPDTGNTNGKPENKLDVFVAKFSADGSALEYSAYIGAAGVKDVGMGIALGSGGNVYVTGITTINNQTDTNNFPVTANAFQGTYGGGDSDAFVFKLSPMDGAWVLTYSTYLGDQVTEPIEGVGSDEGHSIAADGSGHVYVTGMTDSKFFPFKNGFDDTYAANPDNANQNKPDAFVTKLSYKPLILTAPNGGEIWTIETITWIYDLPLIPSNTRVSLILLKDDAIVGYLNDIDNNEYFNISDSSYAWRVEITLVDRHVPPKAIKSGS